jgi:hypothetical protein
VELNSFFLRLHFIRRTKTSKWTDLQTFCQNFTNITRIALGSGNVIAVTSLTNALTKIGKRRISKPKLISTLRSRTVLDEAAEFREAAEESGFELLDITLEHTASATALPFTHRDPFDRMLIAQAVVERMALAKSDPVFRKYRSVNVLPS